MKKLNYWTNWTYSLLACRCVHNRNKINNFNILRNEKLKNCLSWRNKRSRIEIDGRKKNVTFILHTAVAVFRLKSVKCYKKYTNLTRYFFITVFRTREYYAHENDQTTQSFHVVWKFLILKLMQCLKNFLCLFGIIFGVEFSCDYCSYFVTKFIFIWTCVSMSMRLYIMLVCTEKILSIKMNKFIKFMILYEFFLQPQENKYFKNTLEENFSRLFARSKFLFYKFPCDTISSMIILLTSFCLIYFHKVFNIYSSM